MDAILSDQYSRDDPAGQLAAAGFSAGRVGMGRSDDAAPGVRIERDEHEMTEDDEILHAADGWTVCRCTCTRKFICMHDV